MPRVLVPRVDFVSAPGTSPPGVHRPGGPSHVLTGRALFAFDRAAARFRLAQVHSGETVAGVRAATACRSPVHTMLERAVEILDEIEFAAP